MQVLFSCLPLFHYSIAHMQCVPDSVCPITSEENTTAYYKIPLSSFNTLTKPFQTEKGYVSNTKFIRLYWTKKFLFYVLQSFYTVFSHFVDMPTLFNMLHTYSQFENIQMVCINTDYDNQNCGRPGHRCHLNQICQSGRCVLKIK